MLLILMSLGQAAPWSAAMASGDCPSVLSAISAPTSELEQLAVGRCRLELGQAGSVLEGLNSMHDPALAPYVALLRGRAQLELGHADQAVSELSKAPAGPETQLLKGRALVEAHRSLEARDSLRGLLEGPYGAEARYWLAVGAEDRGDHVAAIGTYQAVWSKNPTSPWASKAQTALLDLKVVIPDFATPDGRNLVMTRVKTLLSMHLASDAIPLLDTLHSQDPFDTPEEQRFFAAALFDARQYKRAVEWYGRAGATQDAPTMFEYALATARSGDYKAASAIYTALIEKFPTSAQADEATYKLPYMHFDAKEWAEAVEGFDHYLQRFPSGKFSTSARWFRAWSKWKGKGDTSAFEEVIRSGDGERAIAARYWKARLANDTEGLQSLLRSAPESAYAYFAGARLGIKAPTPSALPAHPTFPEGFVTTRPSLGTALRLLDGGMADWARPLLRAHVAAAQSAGKESTLAMAWALMDAEDYKGAQELARPYCGSSITATAACYPRPHDRTVQSVAASYGLDPLLPYAIMNAESGLDPSVTSIAGARGLMQLMPELSKTLADDIPGYHIDQLYRAGINARLGSKELGLINKHFNNVAVQPMLPLVIASYNGGMDATDRWLGSYPSPPDIDLFCEEISFTETRLYVRRVLGYLMQYRRVYAK